MKNNAVLLKFYVSKCVDTKIYKFLSKEEVYINDIENANRVTITDHNLFYFIPISEVKTNRKNVNVIKTYINKIQTR